MTPKPSIAELTIEEPSIRLAALTFEHEATSRVVAVVEQLVARVVLLLLRKTKISLLNLKNLAS